MGKQRSIKIDQDTGLATLVMPVSDLDLITNAVQFQTYYTSDNYGLGWEDTADGRESKRSWSKLVKIGDRLTRALSKYNRSTANDAQCDNTATHIDY